MTVPVKLVKPSRVKESGVVDSFGVEFGFELILALPYAYWLHENGLLEQTISCKDTAPFYWFSPKHVEKYNTRFWTIEVYKYYLKKFPLQTMYRSVLDKSKWIAPPMKEHFKNDRFVYNKPLFIITNKYVNEFNDSPRNYYPPAVLRRMFDMLKDTYQIVYSRLSGFSKKYYADDIMNEYYDFGDKRMIKNEYNNDVLLIEEMYLDSGMKSFNEFQCMLYANCDYFVGVQGGNSVLSSFFSKINYIYAVSGGELTKNSYGWFNEFCGSEIKVFNNWERILKAIEKKHA